MRTNLEFEVVGSTVQELRDKAMETVKKAAGSGTWTLQARVPAEPEDYVEDSYITGQKRRDVHLWKQTFSAVIDFD